MIKYDHLRYLLEPDYFLPSSRSTPLSESPAPSLDVPGTGLVQMNGNQVMVFSGHSTLGLEMNWLITVVYAVKTVCYIQEKIRVLMRSHSPHPSNCVRYARSHLVAPPCQYWPTTSLTQNHESGPKYPLAGNSVSKADWPAPPSTPLETTLLPHQLTETG